MSFSEQATSDVTAEGDKFVAFGGVATEGEAAPEGQCAAPFDGFFE